MDIEQLKTGLRRDLPPEPGTNCPPDELVATYLEGGLSEDGHRSFEQHLASCDWCLERVGLIGRLASDDQAPGIPETALARARNLVPDGQRKRFWPQPRAWAAAAVLLLALSLFLVRPGMITPEPEADPGAPIVRNVNPNDIGSSVLAAGDGIRIRFQPSALEWTPVAGSLFYRVLVVTDEGDLVWEGQVDDPKWMLPENLTLDRDADYFVRVEAYLSETQAVNSEFELLDLGRVR
jgi:hypothetical protein